MRIAAALILTTFALPGQPQAETAGPIFGSAAAGPFQVADQAAEAHPPQHIVVHAASDCGAPDCGKLVKTANLPASGKKP